GGAGAGGPVAGIDRHVVWRLGDVVASLPRPAWRPDARRDRGVRGEQGPGSHDHHVGGEESLHRSLLSAGVAALVLLPHRGLVLLLVIGGFYQGLSYLAAPAMAMLAERDVATESSRPQVSTPGEREAVERGQLTLTS